MNTNRHFRQAWQTCLAAVVLGVSAGLAWPAVGGEFVPHCADAAPGVTISDLEVDGEYKLATWNNEPRLDVSGNVLVKGSISVAALDASGRIRTEERFDCLDCDPVSSYNGPVNGPEIARPLAVYYTAYTDNCDGMRLAKIVPDGETWKRHMLPDADGKMAPVGTSDEGSVETRVLYLNVSCTLPGPVTVISGGWRLDSEAADDHSLDPRITSCRFLPGGGDMVCIRKEKKTLANILFNTTISQPGVYATGTGTYTPLLPRTDLTPESSWDWPAAWRAPELHGGTALMTTLWNAAQKRAEAVVWRLNDGGKWEEWTRILPMNPLNSCLYRPEIFVLKGRSYVAFSSHPSWYCDPSVAKAWKSFGALFVQQPTDVWIASVDPLLQPDQQVRRIVSEDPAKGKFAAEVAVFDAGSSSERAMVYYHQFEAGGLSASSVKVCESGL